MTKEEMGVKDLGDRGVKLQTEKKENLLWLCK